MIGALDPGASPTLALLDDDGVLAFIEGDALAGRTATGKTRPIPELCLHALLPAVGRARPDLLIIEDSRGLPGDSRGSGEALVACVALFHGIAVALGIRVHRVQPVQWKRHHGLLKAEKDASRAAACRLFPRQAELFRRKLDHNRAEAALMAAWGGRLSRHRHIAAGWGGDHGQAHDRATKCDIAATTPATP